MPEINTLKEEQALEANSQMITSFAEARKSAGGKKNRKIFLYGALGAVALVILVVFGVGIYKIYVKADTGRFAVAFTFALRLPIAKIDGVPVRYSEYAEDVKAIRAMREYDKKNSGPGSGLSDEQISDQVLWRLANNILLARASEKYGLRIDEKEVDILKSQVAQQFKDSAALESELMNRYGWSFATYERKVIRPFVLQNRLNEAVQADPSLREEVVRLASEALSSIKSGADFAQMARQYGQDGTAANGGDLGWFARGEMVPEFEDMAFTLAKGQVAESLVQSQFGYHIIKLDDRKKEKQKSKTVEKIRARHILFRYPSADKYLDDMARRADIHLYARVHNPFEELKKS